MELKIPSKIEFSNNYEEIGAENVKCCVIKLNDIPRLFSIRRVRKTFILKYGRSRPMTIEIPFKLDNKIARLCGMILDGYIAKDFSAVSFTQGKDREKAKEFGNIVKSRFRVEPRYYRRDGYLTVTISSKSLCYFLNLCVDIHKSDENARIPVWIKNSSFEILREYLRYAFAMEGSVSDPLKGEKEIKFHSCDKSFLVELSDIMLSRFGIRSYIQEYTIKGYGKKYYISISGKDNLLKFSKIGFALESHQERIEKILESYKPKAWEITLVAVNKIGKPFTLKDANILFPYLLKSSVHKRLSDLKQLGFVSKNRNMYTITSSGKNTTKSISDKIVTVRLRTNPKENERMILDHLKNKKSHISQTSRELGIHVKTVRDSLRRLEAGGKIRMSGTDKFQRKFYEIKGKGR